MNSANATALRERAIDVLGEVNNEDNQLRILQVLNGGYNDKSLRRPSNRVCLPIGKVCVEKKRNLTKVNSQPRTCLASPPPPGPLKQLPAIHRDDITRNSNGNSNI